MSKDYYEILGVEKNSSKDDIKRAFRKKAHQYHPDKNGGDDSKFKEANEAYQTLSNDQKRAQYDQFGSAGFQGGGGGGFGFSGFQQQGFDVGDLGDIFGEFFTGGMGGGQRTKRGRDISTEIDISFEDAVFGGERSVLITKQSTCDSCGGSGAKSGTSMETCGACNGNGQVRENKRSILGTFSTVKTCEVCNGQGEVPKEKCSKCRGKGIIKKQEEIVIKIPAGINNGEMIRMSGMGEAVKNGQTGDLYIKINVRPHKRFKREGYNLHTDLKIKLTDALLGTKYPLETLEGKVEIKIPEGINNGELLRVRGKGVPHSSLRRGDIIVKILIDMPSKLSRKQKKVVQELKKEGI
ncbi:MAG: molecular chaperone DnaJ [Patescibacteria group bacterium]|nr:molecular chaperone DnaJ [Patescibacteria group bacterium]